MNTKKLKWFKEGEAIPANATFIKSERRVVGVRTVRDEDYPYGGQASWSEREVDVLEEQYLYEVSDPA